ncbi:hypothetical protein MHH52_21425 [Paenibacillus sp. FSL K6-0276]|uniref:MGDG synthase family glycosyltransferase n=1 Tax=Paenibacillus sp. FSL K6-0276 TaxID=2921450 RepID=UPI0030EEBB10
MKKELSYEHRSAELASTTGSRIPLFTVMTDNVVHGRWLHPQTTKYFIATESVKAALMSAGIAEEKLVVSGIPIREAIKKQGQRQRKQFGLVAKKRQSWMH